MADHNQQSNYTPYSPPVEAPQQQYHQQAQDYHQQQQQHQQQYQQQEQQQYHQQQYHQQQQAMTPPANATSSSHPQVQAQPSSDAPPDYYNQTKAAQPQQQQPQQQAQPQQAYVPSIPLHMLKDASQYVDCPFCHKHTQTQVTTSGSDKQIIVGALLCLICVCLACIPCIAHWFEVTEFRCGACNQLLASRPSDGAMQVYGPSAPVVVQPGQNPAMQLQQVQNKTAYQQQMGMPAQPAPTAQPTQHQPQHYEAASPGANYGHGQPVQGSPAPYNGQAHGVAPVNTQQYGVSGNEKSAAVPPQ